MTNSEKNGEDPERRHKAASARRGAPSGWERAGAPLSRVGPRPVPPSPPPSSSAPRSAARPARSAVRRNEPRRPSGGTAPAPPCRHQLPILPAAHRKRNAGSRMHFRGRGGGAGAAPRCHGNWRCGAPGWGRFSEAVPPSVSAAQLGAGAACTTVGRPELSPRRP